MNKNIQDAEDQWLDDNDAGEWMLVFQGVLWRLGIICLFCVLFAQTFKWGQRHPDPAKFVTYAAAIDLANEREAWGRSACK